MQREYFTSRESLTPDDSLPLHEFIHQIAYNDQGLIPVIAQDLDTGEVLMLAWMNKTSLLKTLETNRMTYWSRSRDELWEKGATSGHYQHLHRMRFDCDGDAVLCQVTQIGGACHTGRSNCFYFEVDNTHQAISITAPIPLKDNDDD